MGKESTADAKTDAIPRRKFLADSLAGAVSLSVAGCAQSRSTLNNKEPGDRAGRIAMTLAEKREDLRRKYIESIGPIPEPVPLDLCVESKREIYGNYFSDYEEWRIEYSVESPDTMAEPAGRTIPAYLLIPKGARHQPPFPAMICYHQCGLDCAVGKDAVVGRFPERQHQQYGYELVQKGFVVLAPDAICCGERQVPWVQKEGAYGPGVRRECWFKGQHGKNSPIMDHFGRSWQNKVVTDGLRSVDLLQSLEFVDSERIGAIGHSLGARQTGTHMAYDTRVRAGILSPGGLPDRRLLACIAPRLLIALQGSSNGPTEAVAKGSEDYATGRQHYEELGRPDDLVLSVHPCAHYFADDFKWEAYATLKKYFGIGAKSERFVVEDVLKTSSVSQHVDLSGLAQHNAVGDKEQLTDMFYWLFALLESKIPGKDKLRARIDTDVQRVNVVATIPVEHAEVESQLEYLTRRIKQALFENDGSLEQETMGDEARYIVSLRPHG